MHQQKLSNLQTTLFNGDHAVCKERDPQWSKRIYLGKEQSDIHTFRAWLQHKLDTENPTPTPALVARFARLAMDVAEQEGCKKEEQRA